MKLKNERIIHLNWWIAGLGVPPTRADRRKHGLLRWMFPNGLRRRCHHPHTQRDMASGCLYQCHLPDQKRRRTKNKHETIQTNSIQTSPHWRFFFFFYSWWSKRCVNNVTNPMTWPTTSTVTPQTLLIAVPSMKEPNVVTWTTLTRWFIRSKIFISHGRCQTKRKTKPCIHNYYHK